MVQVLRSTYLGPSKANLPIVAAANVVVLFPCKKTCVDAYGRWNGLYYLSPIHLLAKAKVIRMKKKIPSRIATALRDGWDFKFGKCSMLSFSSGVMLLPLSYIKIPIKRPTNRIEVNLSLHNRNILPFHWTESQSNASSELLRVKFFWRASVTPLIMVNWTFWEVNVIIPEVRLGYWNVTFPSK